MSDIVAKADGRQKHEEKFLMSKGKEARELSCHQL